MFKLTNKQYDASKWAITVGMPGVMTAYASLAVIWGWSGTDKVLGTLAAITTLGGLFLGISSQKYGAGGSDDGTDDDPEGLFGPEGG